MAYKDVIEQAAATTGHAHGFGHGEGKTPEERFADLQEIAATYLSPEEEATLVEAFEFANEAHKSQKRRSGEPYIIHPIEVTIILAGLHMDVETLVAALLHDTIEDTEVTREDVVERFGEDVAALVEGVTKITQIEVATLTDEQAATIRKMLVAMNKDIRVIVIKLADRLHNMRTLSSLREDRRTNRTMSLLTWITTIFLPVTVVAGFFSMNDVHHNMPFQSLVMLCFAITVISIVLIINKKRVK